MQVDSSMADAVSITTYLGMYYNSHMHAALTNIHYHQFEATMYTFCFVMRLSVTCANFVRQWYNQN